MREDRFPKDPARRFSAEKSLERPHSPVKIQEGLIRRRVKCPTHGYPKIGSHPQSNFAMPDRDEATWNIGTPDEAVGKATTWIPSRNC
jgi:hypothetical protein